MEYKCEGKFETTFESKNEPKDNPHQGLLQKSYWGVWCLPQPIRTSHCFKCNKWVATYDHHSVWIGNWVGEKNRKDFLIFLIICLFHLGVQIVLTFMNLAQSEEAEMWYVYLLMISIIIAFILITVTMINIWVQLYLCIAGYTLFEITSRKKIWYLQNLPFTCFAPFTTKNKLRIWSNISTYFWQFGYEISKL